ncbi:MAG: hypothetical protein HY307_02940, partial [Arcobacter sp.]|nr:hypothetical protein [Arcobacter sp.]
KSHQNGEIGNSEIQPNLPVGVSACSAEGQAYKKEQDEKKAAEKSGGCCGGGHCDS